MYRVLWARAALNNLAAAWTNADSAGRQAITAATTVIDRLLSDDPENQGESRNERDRIFFARPLGVTYRVYPSQRVVRVLQLWRFRQRH
jgi:hypothetical protein